MKDTFPTVFVQLFSGQGCYLGHRLIADERMSHCSSANCNLERLGKWDHSQSTYLFLLLLKTEISKMRLFNEVTA